LKAKQYLFNHHANGNFKPVISRAFRLAEIVGVHRYTESNTQIGKIVVTV
jgi:NADPH:quinone reductase-like Zn-dependent oxidoreductase